MKEPSKAEMTLTTEPTRLVPRNSKRGAMNALAPHLVGLPSRALSHLDHLNRELNRKTAGGTPIPDDAAIFSTGEIVRVKGEAFRIKSLDTKRLVIEGVKEETSQRPWLDVNLFETDDAAVRIGAFFQAEKHDPTEIDRFDVDQRLTHEGIEYVVTGKALILAPVLDKTEE